MPFFLTSKIIQEMPFFQDLQPLFFTYHMNYRMRVFKQRMPWAEILQSLSILFGFNITLPIIGCAAFQVRYIKS